MVQRPSPSTSRGAGAALLAALAVLPAACSTEYMPVALTPHGADVVVSTDGPAPGCVDLGPIEAHHGTQCNAFGRTGTKEGAYVVLRNSAASRGADFVQVERELPPDPPRDNCLWGLRGHAYKCGE